MRFSTDKSSPYYNEAAQYIKEVKLNNIVQDSVIEFDTVLGLVYKHYDDLREDQFGNYLVECVKGKVTFKLGANIEIVGGILRFAK